MMQGKFGDNLTPKPSALDLVENLKYNNWKSYKGMDKLVARKKWLNLFEPLILAKGYPKCDW